MVHVAQSARSLKHGAELLGGPGKKNSTTSLASGSGSGLYKLGYSSSAYGHGLSRHPHPQQRCSVYSNFLRPNTRFTGFQMSGYKKYQVDIVLKTVALPADSTDSTATPHLSGLLSIQGLTTQHPQITTFFEGYVVTSKDPAVSHGFLSSNWDKHNPLYTPFLASDKTDMQHWLNFPQFKSSSMSSSYLNERYIFMRWKEKFLVPDPVNSSIEGASFDGFYYIVHDQLTGNIQGFYYHEKAEKFQQLNLIPREQHATHTDASYEFA